MFYSFLSKRHVFYLKHIRKRSAFLSRKHFFLRKAICFYLKDIQEQRKYIEKSINLTNHIDHLNENSHKKIIELNYLKSSILNQAFSFELTENVA